MEDELFRFARAIEGNDELRTTLADPHVPAAVRQQIVQDLLGGKASNATVAVVGMVVGAGRVADLPKIVDSVLARSASRRGELVAEVRSAVALSPEQQQRLAAALMAQTPGTTITVRNVVDPTVLGGVVTTIGDSVIDGSVRTRLTQLRDAF
jgi:F-type H+-transporting ATPase subunit delta